MACTVFVLSPAELVSDSVTVNVPPTVVLPLDEKENEASPDAKAVPDSIAAGNTNARTPSTTLSHAARNCNAPAVRLL